MTARRSFPANVWPKINKHGPVPDARPDLGRCWLWTGGLTALGYGNVKVKGTTRFAHLVVYELLIGSVPDGLELDHLCRNPTCVNPSHLEAVTHRENVLRGVSAAAENARKTACVRGHPLSGANVYCRADGSRQCRICQRAAALRYYHRNRERSLEQMKAYYQRRKAGAL